MRFFWGLFCSAGCVEAGALAILIAVAISREKAILRVDGDVELDLILDSRHHEVIDIFKDRVVVSSDLGFK